MSSKKFKKIFKSFEKRLTTLENRFYGLFERGIEIIETQINQLINTQEGAEEFTAAEIISTDKKSKKAKKNKEQLVFDADELADFLAEAVGIVEQATGADAAEEEAKPKAKATKAKAKTEKPVVKTTKAKTAKADAVSETTPEVKTRRPYTRKADKPAEIVYPMTDLRHIKGIADKLATALAGFGVHDVHDFVKMSEGLLEQIEENHKGFKKKMETFQWKAQAQAIIDATA